MGSQDFGGAAFEGISKFLILEGREENWAWGALRAAVWLLLVPCPVAVSRPSKCPELLNYMEKSVLWCLPSPSAQPLFSLSFLLHPHPDLSTDLTALQGAKSLAGSAGPNPKQWGYTWEQSLISFPLPTCPTSCTVTRDGADPAPFPYPVSGLSCSLQCFSLPGSQLGFR